MDWLCDRKQQAALRKEMRGLPADHGYQSPWPQLRLVLEPLVAAALARSLSEVPFYLFCVGWEGSPTKIEKKKQVPLI